MTAVPKTTAIPPLDGGFAAFLRSPKSDLELDLSNATLIEVVQHYERIRKKTNPNFTRASLIYNLKIIEDLFGCIIMPSQVNEIFYSYFISYLSEKGLKYSTIESYCNRLRSALRWSMRYHCAVSSSFDQFKVPKYTGNEVALTKDQVSHIYHFNIRNEISYKECPNRISLSYIERVRDWFVLSCNLGQRISDMKRISRSHFDETLTKFTIIQQKTNTKAVVDIVKWTVDPIVTREILEKYNYQAPKLGGTNNYNTALKFLLSKIGGQFLTLVKEETRDANGIVRVREVALKDKVHSHTGRRTYATLMLEARRDPAGIRLCTGHAPGRSFDKYDRRVYID